MQKYDMNELQQKFKTIKENITKEQNERKEKDKINAKIIKQIQIIENAEAKVLKEKIKLDKLLQQDKNKELKKDEK